ncbi:hypothetical protein KKF91_10900 [Myxococcota bacterium]|nr:hypothetical protein [Myxococcota bacterium]MBU1431040.1 hypothetical protein [Myxococcota bacterium]MBU1898627.1 hypothetical protein [Myxococcota bacterium]
MPIHMTNAAGLNATLHFEELLAEEIEAETGPGLRFTRFLTAVSEGLHERLSARLGDHYAQALIDGDPEVDIERVGMRVARVEGVYLDGEGQEMTTPPLMMEALYDPQGVEVRRAPFEASAPNINTYAPLRWLGAPMPIDVMVRRFVIRRSVQLYHSDGLSFDYLYQMAKALSERDEVVAIGAGPMGQSPLIFQQNGAPYRGFLEGRVEADAYQLLLHLSHMELKPIEEAR